MLNLDLYNKYVPRSMQYITGTQYVCTTEIVLSDRHSDKSKQQQQTTATLSIQSQIESATLSILINDKVCFHHCLSLTLYLLACEFAPWLSSHRLVVSCFVFIFSLRIILNMNLTLLHLIEVFASLVISHTVVPTFCSSRLVLPLLLLVFHHKKLIQYCINSCYFVMFLVVPHRSLSHRIVHCLSHQSSGAVLFLF